MTGIRPTALFSTTATRASAQQASQNGSNDNNGTPNALYRIYKHSSQVVQEGLDATGNAISKIYPHSNEQNNVVRFARKQAGTVASKFIPLPTNVDKVTTQIVGSDSSEASRALAFVQQSLDVIITKNGWLFKKDKYELAWNKLTELQNPENQKELLETFKLKDINSETSQQFLGDLFASAMIFGEKVEAKKTELDASGISFHDILANVAKRNSGFRAIRDFVVLPFVGSGAFNIGRFFMQMGSKPAAQAFFFAGMGLSSAPSFLIAENVSKHMTFEHLVVEGGKHKWLNLLPPFIRLGTILSHTISPLLNMLGIAFNFDGFVSGGKDSNLFGKVTGFLNNIFELLRPMSMLGFALNHLSGMNKTKIDYKEGTNLFKTSMAHEKLGFWVNMVGFSLWSVSQVASMFIEHHQKQVNAEFEPIIQEIQERLMAEQSHLKEAVIKGKITKEAAIERLTKLEAEAKQFIQEKLLPQYDEQMKGWKTASWAVDLINWLAFLGVNVQMYTGGLWRTASNAAQKMDAPNAVDKAGKPLTFFKAFQQSLFSENQGNKMQSFIKVGGIGLGLTGLVAQTLLDGVSTVFGANSPFAGLDKKGFGNIAEDIKRNPVFSLFMNMFMFAG